MYSFIILRFWPGLGIFYFFFFKQKTDYGMRISDWSSDVCSSDLLSGIFDLRIGCAHGSRQSGCRHRAGRADLALTADLGPGNGRVELDEHADRAGGQQDIVHARAIRTRPEIPIVAQHGGDDARGAVGGCSDDPSRSEEHTSELQSLMRISYAVFCLKK